ncbi:uncharacterized protein LOC130746013 [Lotus japonicus]|uniref:uncharacterized protein LOC130746013 n=1 Tax=Lotus japonicus TaxID=34305 RepID=UPI002588EFB6|nr:uncharacterized protein LOC130746013 [Lotus japonicus]
MEHEGKFIPFFSINCRKSPTVTQLTILDIIKTKKPRIILLNWASFLFRLWLLKEGLPQPAPWLNQVESAGAGGNAPHGGGFDIGWLETKLRR